MSFEQRRSFEIRLVHAGVEGLLYMTDATPFSFDAQLRSLITPRNQ